jgi:hypothetical protein
MAVTAAADAGFVTDISGFGRENVAPEDGFRRTTVSARVRGPASVAADIRCDRGREGVAMVGGDATMHGSFPGYLLYYTTVSGYS